MTGAAIAEQTVRLRSTAPAPDDERVAVLLAAIKSFSIAGGCAAWRAHISQAVWGDAAGVVLQMHKERMPIRVEPEWAHVFGEPLTVRGSEDCLIDFEPAEAADPRRSPGHPLATAGNTVVYGDRFPRALVQ